ncbi:unknown [Fusobacterium nucleatum subsp. nucleatum ATCC 25586]|uniref:Uncharacterized protein n=1 Tax=Fusobacterium nucleatum subsp. nucleatum (strain ATCC 25586 / DSM 15643 / BCRC 10681 / CIP 101130 / JCM 8532 / KCTC 2640 / LMG 13131 / VPI 4355) TaxID=190304 RepID=Q8RHP8_FUSNN|nr:unknown [Fusobacterium nucleatum subsp. nucleatum ATCC 25586]
MSFITPLVFLYILFNFFIYCLLYSLLVVFQYYIFILFVQKIKTQVLYLCFILINILCLPFIQVF